MPEELQCLSALRTVGSSVRPSPVDERLSDIPRRPVLDFAVVVVGGVRRGVATMRAGRRLPACPCLAHPRIFPSPRCGHRFPI